MTLGISCSLKMSGKVRQWISPGWGEAQRANLSAFAAEWYACCKPNKNMLNIQFGDDWLTTLLFEFGMVSCWVYHITNCFATVCRTMPGLRRPQVSGKRSQEGRSAVSLLLQNTLQLKAPKRSVIEKIILKPRNVIETIHIPGSFLSKIISHAITPWNSWSFITQ